MSDINSIWDGKLLEVEVGDVRDNNPKRPPTQWHARGNYRDYEGQGRGIVDINRDSKAKRGNNTYREMIPNDPMCMIGRECH